MRWWTAHGHQFLLYYTRRFSKAAQVLKAYSHTKFQEATLSVDNTPATPGSWKAFLLWLLIAADTAVGL